MFRKGEQPEFVKRLTCEYLAALKEKAHTSLNEDIKGFWAQYQLKPIKTNEEHFSYIKQNDIYTEFKCSNEEIFKEELENYSDEIAYISEAEEDEYRPFGLKREERAMQLRLRKHALKKSIRFPLLFTILYILLLLNIISLGDDFVSAELMLLIFAVIPCCYKLISLVEPAMHHLK